MFPMISALILLTCVGLISGAPGCVSTDKDDAPILYEKCYGDLGTKDTYHIQLLGLHKHGSKMKPATSCGDPQGSCHYNLHFDICLPGKKPPCNNCKFPFTTWDRYTALRNKYLTPVFNWHAFQYTSGGLQCICLYDSVSGAKHYNCFETDVKAALLLLVANVQGLAEEIWDELENLPWTSKAAIIALVVAACVVLLPLIMEAAGVAITAELVAEMVALFVSWATTRFVLL